MNKFQSCCDLEGFTLTSAMKRDHMFDLISAYGLNNEGGAGFYKAKTKHGANYCGFAFRTAGSINGDVRIFASKAIMITWTSVPLNEFSKKVNLKSLAALKNWAKDKSEQLNGE